METSLQEGGLAVERGGEAEGEGEVGGLRYTLHGGSFGGVVVVDWIAEEGIWLCLIIFK